MSILPPPGIYVPLFFVSHYSCIFLYINFLPVFFLYIIGVTHPVHLLVPGLQLLPLQWRVRDPSTHPRAKAVPRACVFLFYTTPTMYRPCRQRLRSYYTRCSFYRKVDVPHFTRRGLGRCFACRVVDDGCVGARHQLLAYVRGRVSEGGGRVKTMWVCT